MPESDVSKMKVADLKRELKLRGLATTGNKTELQDRLQTALIDGDLSLEDTAIPGEDALLDDDTVLTDEDEAKILGGDENELLKSPTTILSTAPDLTLLGSGATGKAANSTDVLPSPTASKKIVLKRKNSFTSTASSAITSTAKENAEPTASKTIKMSERNPITAFGGSSDNANSTSTIVENSSDAGATSKISQLTLQERLDLRAKKFGTKANTTPTVAADGTITAAAPAGTGDEKQIEMLKKRAERFGCVVSSKIAKIDAEEKLIKRKQRFGGGAEGADAAGATNTTGTSSVWAEKARLRLERFKNSTSSTAAAESTAIPAGSAAVASATEN